ncbi:MAG: type II secretion system F family protein [Vicinamibacterales bacterium]
MIIVLTTFLAILGLVLGAYWVFVLRLDQSDEAALRKRLRPDGATKAAPKQSRLLKPAERLSHMSQLNNVLTSMSRVTAPMQRNLTQAGVSLTLGTLLLSAACLAFGGYLIVRLFTFNSLLAMAGGFCLFFVPFLYVKYKRSQRLAKFEEQFPEAIDLISRALRAGHAFTTGLAMAAEEIPPPVGEEFKLLYDRQNFGMPLPDALKAFAARIPLIDARFFATAVLTQRETGGNLGEVLDNLASVIRERFKVKRQVRVLTAHGRITGWILAALPPALAGAMFVMSPGHMKILTDDPLGVQMIIGALILQVMGTVIIRKLVNIRY